MNDPNADHRRIAMKESNPRPVKISSQAWEANHVGADADAERPKK